MVEHLPVDAFALDMPLEAGVVDDVESLVAR
jgi:hypothetical protein